MEKHLYVVSYDIVRDQPRRKMAKTLEDYGKRVQYSVFECEISDHKMNELYRKLTELIQGEEGSIRIYHICTLCRRRLSVIGEESEKTSGEDTIVI